MYIHTYMYIYIYTHIFTAWISSVEWILWVSIFLKNWESRSYEEFPKRVAGRWKRNSGLL